MAIYQDFRLEFDIHPIKKDLVLVSDETSVLQSIRNLIMMNHYESPFSPDKGCNIRKQLFEPISDFTAQDIGRWIRETIVNFEPRANISKLNVIGQPNNNSYSIDMEIFIDTSAEPLTVNFILERLR